MESQQSDEQLLDAYFEGDGEAYEVFFKRHFKRVVAFAIKNGVPHNDASDVAQDTFAKLHKSIHLYEHGRPALAWFLTIAKNGCHDWRRRNQNFQKESSLNEEILQLPSPVKNETNESELGVLKEKLSQLTTDQRLVLEKRVNEDMSFKDIGQSTGKSEVAVRQLFQRAVKTMKRLLAGDNEGDKP